MRFLTWNINSGGGARVPGILEELARLNPDFVTLVEVTSTNLESIRNSLTSLGLRHIMTTSRKISAKNSLLVASKVPLVAVEQPDFDDKERWLLVEVPSEQLMVLSVHVPATTDRGGKSRKGIFWDRLISFAELHRDERVVVLGDFNTGLAEDAEGTPFQFSDRVRILRFVGYVDAWRSLNPTKRDYTWFSNPTSGRRKGFRLDHIYVSPPLRGTVTEARHVHSVRLEQISDHSVVFADIDP